MGCSENEYAAVLLGGLTESLFGTSSMVQPVKLLPGTPISPNSTNLAEVPVTPHFGSSFLLMCLGGGG